MYSIRVIPTQIFFDSHGTELFRHEGFFSREDILAAWERRGYTFTANSASPDKDNSLDEGADAAGVVTNDGNEGGVPAGAPHEERGTDWWFEVIYLHPTLRCHDCLVAEANVRKALFNEFAGELDSGYMRWRTIDYEQPEHRELAELFGISNGSKLALAYYQGGKIASWKTLPDVLDMGQDGLATSGWIIGAYQTFEESCLASRRRRESEGG